MAADDQTLIYLCKMSAVQANSAVRVLAEGYEPLAVCNVGGRFFLIADTCSHGLASLSEGDIEGGQIFCPFHGGSFDIATGKPVERPASIPIPTYPLIEIGGDLFVAAKT